MCQKHRTGSINVCLIIYRQIANCLSPGDDQQFHTDLYLIFLQILTFCHWLIGTASLCLGLNNEVKIHFP